MAALNQLVECRGGYPDKLRSLATVERVRRHGFRLTGHSQTIRNSATPTAAIGAASITLS